MKKSLFLIGSMLLLGNTAHAEKVKTTVYEYEQAATGRKQIYLFALQKEAVQLFVCGTNGSASFPGFKAEPNLDLLAKTHCSPLLMESDQGRMMKGVRNGQLVSLHLGGTETPETRALAMMGDAKSWLAVFNVNENDNETMLFTGVGIEVGPGIPRTDTVRVTLQKVAEGELSGSYPMLPLKSL